MYRHVTEGHAGASAAPDPAARDFIPCIPVGEITSWGEPENFRLLPGATEYRELLAQESRENPQGESSLSPKGLFPGFPRMLRIRVGRFQSPDQKHNGVKLGRSLHVTAGNCVFTVLSLFRRSGVQGIQSPGRVRGKAPPVLSPYKPPFGVQYRWPDQAIVCFGRKLAG